MAQISARSPLYLVLAVWFCVVAAALHPPTPGEQTVLTDHTEKRVAIIGAGSAGTSTAFHLRQYADEANIPLHITIYERNSYVGGRSTTVNAYDSSAYPVELGGSIFVSVNHILQDAVQAFNLSTDDTEEEDPDNLLGIWDGNSIRLTHSISTPSNPLEGWWRKLRLLFRFGTAPLRVQSLVNSVVEQFLKMYEWPLFPFNDLTSAVSTIKLRTVTNTTGWEYLKANGLDGKFAWEIMQAATRVNYASNLDEIHGVESMVSMATDGAVSVDGGNWQIFAGMAEAAHANLRLETEIASVSKNDADAEGYILEAQGESSPEKNAYDAVVVATPFHQTGIDWSAADLKHMPRNDEYRTLHVTLFTTALPLSRDYFNLSQIDAVPTTFLTTMPDCAQPPGSIECKDQIPEFFSVSTLRAVTHPTTGNPELLYKIFTPTSVSDAFLARLFDLELQSDDSISDGDITWMYRKKWLSYPIEYPRDTFEPLRLDGKTGGGDGLWYTGAIEGFISTMETSALMGKNVAKMMADGWQKEQQGIANDYKAREEGEL